MAKKSPVVQIAKKVCPAVITIVISRDLPKVEGFYLFPFRGQELLFPMLKKGKKEKVRVGGGSGFIVSEDGLVITTAHVVEDPKADYTVILEPKKKYQAKVLARDPIKDTAILKIKGKGFPFINLGNSNDIELGQEVVAVGNALGEFHDTLSTGIISGLSRKIQAISPLAKLAQLRGLIQTDAAINPGNSGGPLVDMEGKVIGVNTAMVMGAQNIGFAIPINYIKRDLEEIKKHGKIKRPFLGVRYIPVTKELAKAQKLKVNYGALIIRESLGESAVVKGSSAEKAKLEEFDIILEIDGEKITIDNPLADILQKHKIGEEVTLKILRENKEIKVKTKIGER